MSEGPEIKFKELKLPTGAEKTKIDQIFEVDTRFGIIMAIDSFGSLNIKRLAQILGKNEATIYHHIKWLIEEPELLTLDQQKTLNSKGKYYTLSPLAKNHRVILGLTTGSDKPDQPEERKGTDKINDLLALPLDKLLQVHKTIALEYTTLESIKKEKQLMTYNHVLEDIILSNFETAFNMHKAGKKGKNKNYPFGALSNFSLDMKVTSIHHLYRVIQLLTKLTEDFQELKEEISKEIEDTAEDEIIDLHFHVVGGEVAEFQFQD